MTNKRITLLLIGVLLIALGALFIRSPYWTALTKSKNHFIVHELNDRILYEPGAKVYASKIVDHFSDAIRIIDEKQFRPFEESFNVYVCKSQQSFSEYIGVKSLYPVRGTALRGDVYIAPSAFDFRGKDTHKETLIHELSHLHFRQYLGFVKDRKIPQWFREGFADYVSGSGGEGIMDSTAISNILVGEHFIVQEQGGVFDSFQENLNNLSGPMFHKQVNMFVNFLVDSDSLSFNQLVRKVLDGDSFSKVFREAMGTNVKGKWEEFILHLGTLPSETAIINQDNF